MVFRITQKLAKKIKVVPPAALPPHDNPLIDWTAHLFRVSRWQCIILKNSRCLYSIVMAGKGVASERSFSEQAQKCVREYMMLDGVGYLIDTHVAGHADFMTLCKASDRRVLGSMNDLIHHAKLYLLEMGLPMSLVNLRLNEMPMSVLEFRNPKETLLALAGHSAT